MKRIKPFLLILLLLLFIFINSCEPEVIDLNDDPMPDSLKDTIWVKATTTAHYGDLCIREDFRIFDGSNSKFISKTVYDFMSEEYEDATVIKTYKATFNLDAYPKRMKGVLEKVTLNDIDVTGEEEVQIGTENNLRDFPEEGESLYYVFSTEYREGGIDTLLLASGYELYPDYIAVNQPCYTKKYDESITMIPDDFDNATWKTAQFRDRLQDTVFDEPFAEIKKRKFTGKTDGEHMYIKMIYIFKSLPTEIYLYDFSLDYSEVSTSTSGTATLQSVVKDGIDITGSEENLLGNKEFPIPDTGYNISFILDKNEDIMRFTDIEGETPPITFDGITYTLSDNL
ncbi:MAG: hypothetical protein ACOCV8_03170 [Spirochaetota bacterium]